MNNAPSIRQFQRILAFPFEDPQWKNKLLTGMALTLGGLLLPVIPILFVMGYGYQITHRLIVDQGDLYLPEWTNWSKLLKDGWRLFSVSFIYSLPASIIAIIGIITYFGVFIFIMTTSGSSSNEPAAVLLLFGGLAIQILTTILSMLLGLVSLLILPAALGHTVARDSFSAGFDFIGWWKVLKANFTGFFMALIIIMGISMMITLAMQIFYMTIVLICLVFIIPMVFSFYAILITSALIGMAYREGMDNLKNAS
jgi:hypothetical protein